MSLAIGNSDLPRPAFIVEGGTAFAVDEPTSETVLRPDSAWALSMVLLVPRYMRSSALLAGAPVRVPIDGMGLSWNELRLWELVANAPVRESGTVAPEAKERNVESVGRAEAVR